MKCVHCEKPIKGDAFIYPRSEASAHPECVSQPSIAAIDEYLVRQRAQRSSNHVRVWSTSLKAVAKGA